MKKSKEIITCGITAIAFFALVHLNVSVLSIIILLISMIAIFIKAKISFFSIISLFVTYVSFPVFYQQTYNRSYGVLEFGAIPIYEMEIYATILLFNIAVYFLCSFTNVLKKEKELYDFKMRKSKLFCYGCCFVTVLFSIISFPKFGGERFDALLPGDSWNHLVIVALVFLMFYFKESNVAKISFLFAFVWFILHGERVDMLGYIIGVFLIISNRFKIKLNLKKIVVFGLSGITLLSLFLVVGMIRNNMTINLKNILFSFFVQPTAADVAYVFNSSIHFSKTEELFFGNTYLKNLSVFVPLLKNDYLAQFILSRKYGAPGGEYYFCESIMNFGCIIGPIFSIGAFCAISYILLNLKATYFKLCTFFIACAIPRLIWYGKNYLVTALTIFIPVALLINYFIQKKGGFDHEKTSN